MSWLSETTGIHISIDSHGIHGHVDWNQLRDFAEFSAVNEVRIS